MDIFQFLNNENKRYKAIAICIVLLAMLIGLGKHYIFSIASLLGFDFATSVIPGWHTTIYPPIFILALTFSTLLFLQIIAVLSLHFFKNKGIINEKVVEYVNIGLIMFGGIIGINYLFELFVSWYSGYIYEQYAFYNRAFGIYWRAYFISVLIVIILPQLFWFSSVRKSIWATLIISLCLIVNGFLVRIIIASSTTERDYLSSSWSYNADFNYQFLFLLLPIAVLILLIFCISRKKNV
jgi:hypothetical protein